MQIFAPSVMTLDAMIPGLDEFEVLKFMREDYSDIRILVVYGMPRQN